MPGPVLTSLAGPLIGWLIFTEILSLSEVLYPMIGKVGSLHTLNGVAALLVPSRTLGPLASTFLKPDKLARLLPGVSLALGCADTAPSLQLPSPTVQTPPDAHIRNAHDVHMQQLPSWLQVLPTLHSTPHPFQRLTMKSFSCFMTNGSTRVTVSSRRSTGTIKVRDSL